MLDVYIYDLVDSQVVGQDSIANRQGLRFTREYPGGIAVSQCSFFVARNVKEPWDINLHNRLSVFNGLHLVWEGEITAFTPEVSQGVEGDRITAKGYWDTMLGGRRWRKWFSDTRLTQDVWTWRETASGADKCFLDREARLRFTPKAEVWANNDAATVVYTPPTGTTIGRIEYDYDLQEAAQNWQLLVYDETNTTTLASYTTTGSGSAGHTLGTASSSVIIQFINNSGGNQTPTSDGTYYGEVSNVKVFASWETGHGGTLGTFDIAELGEEVVEYLSNTAANYFSGDKTAIETSLTYSLEPFVSENDTLARILERAWEFGDSSNGRVAAGVTLSSGASDRHPKLLVESVPALTDYDYQIDFDSPQLAGRLTLEYSTDDLANYVTVEYVDEQGFRQTVTPEDDASLTDTASVSSWGQRDYVLRLGQVTQAQAIHMGETYLTRHKDPEWTMAPVRVRGYIEKKAGIRLPAAEIEPGKRIKVSSFLDDGSGTWHTYLITRVQYDEDSQIATLSTRDTFRTDPLTQRLRAGLEI